MNKHHLLPLLCLSCLLITATSVNFFNKISISNKTTPAACLDGSEYGFYIWTPDDEQKPLNKLLIYFRETPFGWCVQQDLSTSIEKCRKFITVNDSLYDYGSSQNWASSIMFLEGILSQENAGEFNMWPKVLIQSCDGGAFMGDHDPITYKGHKFHFKGSNNTILTFKYLQEKGYLTGKDEIVIGGSMDGAIAAMQWADTLKSYTTSPIRILADSALHLNTLNTKKNQPVIENRMIMLNKLFMDGKGGPNQLCNSANKDEPWKCFFGGQLVRYMTLPIFFTQSLYDGWSHLFILGIECSQLGTLSECKQEEVQIIEQYHKNISQAVKAVSKQENVSVYSISCVCHEMTGARWLNDDFQVPMLSGNHAEDSVKKWIHGQSPVTVIDEVKWPENKPCSFKLLLQRE